MKARGPATAIDTISRECIAARLRRLGRRVTGIYDDALRPLGLTVSQLTLLVAAGSRGPVRPRDVCALLDLDASTLSRNLERMRARGWVETVEAGDGRAQPVRLTPAGRRLLARAAPAWERAQRRARRLLGEDGVRWLRRAAAERKA